MCMRCSYEVARLNSFAASNHVTLKSANKRQVTMSFVCRVENWNSSRAAGIDNVENRNSKVPAVIAHNARFGDRSTSGIVRVRERLLQIKARFPKTSVVKLIARASNSP